MHFADSEKHSYYGGLVSGMYNCFVWKPFKQDIQFDTITSDHPFNAVCEGLSNANNSLSSKNILYYKVVHIESDYYMAQVFCTSHLSQQICGTTEADFSVVLKLNKQNGFSLLIML